MRMPDGCGDRGLCRIDHTDGFSPRRDGDGVDQFFGVRVNRGQNLIHHHIGGILRIVVEELSEDGYSARRVPASDGLRQIGEESVGFDETGLDGDAVVRRRSARRVN